jgi:hypothetical protein
MGLDSAPIWWLFQGLRLSGAAVDWLLTYLIQSTILIGGVWLLLSTPLGRRLAPASAAWAWRFALVGAVVSASIQSIRTPDPLAGTVRVPGASESAAVRIAVQRVTPGSPITSALPDELRAPDALTWRSTTPTGDHVTTIMSMGPRWSAAVLALWIAGAGACLALFMRARRRFAALLGTKRPGDRTLAGGALRSVRDGAGVHRPIRLTLSECLTSPVAIGASEICLPERTLSELDPIRMVPTS